MRGSSPENYARQLAVLDFLSMAQSAHLVWVADRMRVRSHLPGGDAAGRAASVQHRVCVLRFLVHGVARNCPAQDMTQSSAFPFALGASYFSAVVLGGLAALMISVTRFKRLYWRAAFTLHGGERGVWLRAGAYAFSGQHNFFTLRPPQGAGPRRCFKPFRRTDARCSSGSSRSWFVRRRWSSPSVRNSWFD